MVPFPSPFYFTLSSAFFPPLISQRSSPFCFIGQEHPSCAFSCSHFPLLSILRQGPRGVTHLFSPPPPPTHPQPPTVVTFFVSRPYSPPFQFSLACVFFSTSRRFSSHCLSQLVPPTPNPPPPPCFPILVPLTLSPPLDHSYPHPPFWAFFLRHVALQTQPFFSGPLETKAQELTDTHFPNYLKAPPPLVFRLHHTYQPRFDIFSSFYSAPCPPSFFPLRSSFQCFFCGENPPRPLNDVCNSPPFLLEERGVTNPLVRRQLLFSLLIPVVNTPVFQPPSNCFVSPPPPPQDRPPFFSPPQKTPPFPEFFPFPGPPLEAVFFQVSFSGEFTLPVARSRRLSLIPPSGPPHFSPF